MSDTASFRFAVTISDFSLEEKNLYYRCKVVKKGKIANKFSEDFPHEGNQMFEQIDQESWVMLTHGEFQIVG